MIFQNFSKETGGSEQFRINNGDIMNKVLARLLVFFIGLPLVIGLVYFNQFHHIALHVLTFVSSLLAASELYNLFKQKFSLQPRPLVIVASVIPPFIMALCAFLEYKTSFVD